MHAVFLGLGVIYVVAELLNEDGRLYLRVGWYQEFTGDPQVLAIDELSCGCLQVFIVGGA